jgi:hypothetical protein
LYDPGVATATATARTFPRTRSEQRPKHRFILRDHIEDIANQLVEPLLDIGQSGSSLSFPYGDLRRNGIKHSFSK